MDRNGYKKESVAFVGFVVLNLAILAVGGWFLTSKIMSSSSQLTEEKGVLETTQKNWEQISHSQKELQLIKPELAKIDAAFVPKDQPIEFINLLEDLAQRTNNLFEISLTTVSNPKKKEDGLSFQIRLTGSFLNLMHFLNYMQNMKYRIQIESLDVSAYGAGGASTTKEGKQIPANSVLSTISIKALTN